MNKDTILAEIRRLAQANGGVPVGRLRLEAEAGIKPYHWKKHWSRYSAAVEEAGFAPNTLSQGYAEDELIAFVIDAAREIGRFPTEGDLMVRRTNDSEFPSAKTIGRLGRKAVMVQKVADYCRAHASFEDVLAFCESAAPAPIAAEEEQAALVPASSLDGHVYLMKSGRYYKIGHSVHAGARERQIAIQLPEELATIHVIGTDDPTGIEAYWHRRFAAKRKNGEWFDLSREDVAAFRRRKFM
jgi:hypothetical protein